ncbi:MAG: MFS transporter, partial [Abitibacteriaceae bacterium]|nr:MFS transporter [Abditibacteriaceae bacterium]
MLQKTAGIEEYGSDAVKSISHAVVGVDNVENQAWRFGLLRCLLASAFLLFFQSYMIAPLIPYLAAKFAVSRETVGLMVPAYLLPYALGTFAYGLLADRFGRRGILFVCLMAFAVCCALTATAHSAHDMLVWRILTGFAGSGIAVTALTLIGDTFAFAERGRALGWLFGAIAGGQAFGTTLGGLLTPIIGW